MYFLFRSRLRFSSSKITPVLSVSEAHDRIVYSVREGSAVSSDSSLWSFRDPNHCHVWMLAWNYPRAQSCGCCSLVPTRQAFAEGQWAALVVPLDRASCKSGGGGAVWAGETVVLTLWCFYRPLAPYHWLLWSPSSRSRRSCWRQSPAKLLRVREAEKLRNAPHRRMQTGWARRSRGYIQTQTQVSSALFRALSPGTAAAACWEPARSAHRVLSTRSWSHAWCTFIKEKASRVFSSPVRRSLLLLEANWVLAWFCHCRSSPWCTCCSYFRDTS